MLDKKEKIYYDKNNSTVITERSAVEALAFRGYSESGSTAC